MNDLLMQASGWFWDYYLWATVLLAVVVINPFYWLWRRSVRLDQETLADAAASEVTARADYAQMLVAWARVASEKRLPRLASSVGLWESPSQLRKRLAVLLDEKLTILRSCSRKWRMGAALGLMAATVFLSLFTFDPAKQLAADVDGEEIAATEPDTQPETATRSDDRRLKLMRSIYKRWHSKRKPNTIVGICINEDGEPLQGVSGAAPS